MGVVRYNNARWIAIRRAYDEYLRTHPDDNESKENFASMRPFGEKYMTVMAALENYISDSDGRIQPKGW